MGFFSRLWKSLSTGDPQVAGGDREAQAILREEYPAAAADADSEHHTSQNAHWESVGPMQDTGTFTAGAGPIGMGVPLESNVGGFELAEDDDYEPEPEDNAAESDDADAKSE